MKNRHFVHAGFSMAFPCPAQIVGKSLEKYRNLWLIFGSIIVCFYSGNPDLNAVP
jgi:hypothetical protein